MSSLSTGAIADSGKAVALSVVLGAILAFVPLLSIAAVPAMPVPAAFITTRHGLGAGTLASLAAGMICAVFAGPFTGLLVLLLAALVGVGAGLGLRWGFPVSRLIVSVAVFFLVAIILWMGVLLASTGMGPVMAIESATDQAVEPAGDFYSSVGMSQESIDEAVGRLRDFASTLPYILPAVLLVLSMILSGATVALARQVFERLRQPFPANASFREFRLHFAFAYLMIIGLLCELVSPYLDSPYEGIVSLAGMNLLIVSEVLFFLQGLAIAYFFMCHLEVGRPRRVVVYACMFILQVLFSLVSWLGLFDTWIDYRRRFARKKTQGQQYRQ